jgi:AbrB family looped-hinge helix DNA binding protein
MVFATVSSKGQITLPIMARRMLGIKNYDKVSIKTENGRIILQAVPDILYHSGSAGKAYSISEEKKALKEYVSKKQASGK